MPDRTWLEAVTWLRAAREPGVLVTVAAVRGHAPRAAGAKLVVGAHRTWGSIGGGNLEAVAVDRAREMLAGREAGPELMESALSDKVPYQHGVQCCGGTLTVLSDAVARVRVHRPVVLPETVLGDLPADAHVLIMTHDHAEDLALCDAVLRGGSFGSVGLIGSAGKWARFRRKLAGELGHDAEAIARIKTPIGLPGIDGKEPATIAVSVAADLLAALEHNQARVRR